ncbi:hypothetical protein [Haloarcula nitratireducens]|uniref:Uncharacterized protein n=1 Tax=Haloarcula nitratireducens TaxID=2487749 RepID=A0AAW4PD96_9EURY|nr:hypothetical protein [Halomicroarcula nitratireducens]MBX0295891.1 hypothetical protein [Halomicroarcula nitratireducens]
MSTLRTVGAVTVDACATLVRGVAFWATIPLPVLIASTLVTGFVASSPRSVVALVALNVVCAVVGRNHSPAL